MPGQESSEIAAIRTVHADVGMALGNVSLVSDRLPKPYDNSERAQDHHLQLSLMHYRENGRACFPEAWGRNRFEPIGSLFFLPADQLVHARTDCPEQRAVVYTFSTQALERWFEDGIDWSASQLERSLTIADPEIRRLMIGIGRELRDPGFAADGLIELMAAQVIITLSRRMRSIEQGGAKGGLAPWRLRLIDDFLEQNPAQASLTGLAAECGLSVRQLSRAFRVSRGCSIGAYIAQSRMEFAQRRLAAGVPAKAVAQETGFSSTSNFWAALRRASGRPSRAALTRGGGFHAA